MWIIGNFRMFPIIIIIRNNSRNGGEQKEYVQTPQNHLGQIDQLNRLHDAVYELNLCVCGLCNY